MRVLMSVKGGYSDYLPFASPIDLLADTTDMVRAEGWTPVRVDLGEVRQPLSFGVEFAGSLEIETQSSSVENVRQRTAALFKRLTGRDTVVTIPMFGEPSFEPPRAPNLNVTIGLLAVVAIAALVVVLKVKP